jgi:septal ring factor EnvC (AmiA/AmiB activator)
MFRYLIPAVVMVGAVVVLLAGALGNVDSLPELTTMLRGRVTGAMSGSAQAPPQSYVNTTPVPSTASIAETPQPAVEALKSQLVQLQQQVDQGRTEVAALRAQEDAEQRRLATTQQQRQVEDSAVIQLKSQRQSLADQMQAAQSSASSQPPPAVVQQQASNAALQKQSADLQAQIKQQSDQLAALRANEDQQHKALEALHQQRQAEEAAVAGLKSQKEQLAAAQTPAPQSRREPKQSAPSGHLAATNTTMDNAVAELRARQQRQSVQPPARKAEPVSTAQAHSPGQPVLIVSTKGVLITARELIASGRANEARQLLMRAQAESALRPVTPDQPYAAGGNMVASQIGNAIRFIDSGNSGQAIQAINIAMDNVGNAWASGAAYPPAPMPGGYTPGSSYR